MANGKRTIKIEVEFEVPESMAKESVRQAVLDNLPKLLDGTTVAVLRYLAIDWKD